MRTLILCLLLVAFSGASGAALTLEQAVQQALLHNPEIEQFVALEQAAAARAKKAESPFWPTLSTDYTYITGDRDPILNQDESSAASASARYNLFNGGSDWFRLDEAQHLAAAASYRQRSLVADIMLDVKGAFIEALRAARNVETERKSVELLERQRHDSALRLREGLIARNDLLRVEVELSTAQQRLLRVEGDLHNTRKALARTLGRNLGNSEKIEDFSKRPEPPQSEFADLQRQMFFARSELRFLHNLLAAQHSGQKAVHGDYLPEVDLVLSYRRFGDGSLPQTGDSNYDSDSRAMVEANWTLFSGFDTHYEIAGRREEIRARQKEIRATEDQLTLQLQVALEELRVAQGNLDTAELGVEQAEENYRVNENRYKARVATTVDLLDAQEFLTRARNEQVKARYDLYLAAVALERILEQGPSLSK